MKKFWVFLFTGFLGGLALGGTGFTVTASEVQSASRAAPTATDFTATGSANLTNAVGMKVIVCSNSATDAPQAVGTLKAYGYDERTNQVTRDKLIDLDLSTQESSHCIEFPNQPVDVPVDRVIYAANALKVLDGGTLLTQSDGGLDAGAFTVYYRVWYSGTQR